MKIQLPWVKSVERVQQLEAMVTAQSTQIKDQQNGINNMFALVKVLADQPQAYRWDNPWTWASPHSSTRRPKAQTSLELLRNFADRYDILRSCINHLKREVQAIPFEIVSRGSDSENTARIEQAKEFFGRHGGLGGFGKRPRSFQNEIFEDVLVIGNYAVFIELTRAGRPYQALAIDAATVRPKVNQFGWQDPENAFEQQVMGVPVRAFSSKELLYDGFDPVTNSPYFKSPVEYLLGVVMSALKADEWNRSWLTDGNMPNMMIGAPEEWTPEQIERYDAYFQAILTGNTQERQKVRIVPSGTSKLLDQTRKDMDFQEFERWLMMRTCSIMGVQPASIGYASEQYKYSQEASIGATSMFGVGSLLAIRKELFDDLLEELGFDDLEMVNTPQIEERADARATRLNTETGGPVKTVNEGRGELGLEPVPGGDVIRMMPGADAKYPAETDDDKNEKRIDDLKKWQTKAITRVKGGQPAQCEFRSDYIDDAVNRIVFANLDNCNTTDEVGALFATLRAV